MERIAEKAFACDSPREFLNKACWNWASIRRGNFDGVYLFYFDDRKGNRYYMEPWEYSVREREADG